MRRRPIMINKPVRSEGGRYRPGLAQMLNEAELAEFCVDESAPASLASRKIGSARVVGGTAPQVAS